MPEYVIGVGSNSDDSPRRVARAIEFLEGQLTNVKSSAVYRTPSTKLDGTFYTNAVVSGFSMLDIAEIVAVCKEYEHREGRSSGESRHVVIDLDVVMADEEVLRPRDLVQSYFTIGFNQICR